MKSATTVLHPPKGPALAVLELTSIARSWSVVDAMVKQAPSQIWRTTTLSAGRFLIFVSGGVAEVDESFQAGRRQAGECLLDSVFLPQADVQLMQQLVPLPVNVQVDALGVVECTTCCAAIRGADAAVKAADVGLVHVHLGQGIAGKGLFAFTGELHDVQAGLEEALYVVGKEHLVMGEEIPAPHGAMTMQMLGLSSSAPDY